MLGPGAFGTTFKAKWGSTPVALKFTRPDDPWFGNPEVLRADMESELAGMAAVKDCGYLMQSKFIFLIFPYHFHD